MTSSDLDTCPGCGGDADQGHDRCVPPSPYYCRACDAEAKVRVMEVQLDAECEVRRRLRDAVEHYRDMAVEERDRPYPRADDYAAGRCAAFGGVLAELDALERELLGEEG